MTVSTARKCTGRFGLCLIALLLGLATAAPEARASAKSDAVAKEQQALEQKRAREAELEELNRSITLGQTRLQEITREIRGLDRDRETLNSELIRAGERMKRLESQLLATEGRLARHRVNEDAVRVSLNERRDVLAEVLGALQRIGHRPPPALAVRPQDALSAVRSAILLNAVMPEIRVEAEALASDLAELSRLRGEIEAERNRYKLGATQLAEEQTKVKLLLEKKRQDRERSATQLAAEKAKAEALAAKATSLKELLATLQSEISSAKLAAEAAKKAEEQQLINPAAGDPFSDPGRLAPKVAFAKAKGLLPLPLSGTVVQEFGSDDGFGGTTKGALLISRPKAQVTSPADGWVAFAGEYRSYGQMVILNVGDDYLLLLAGMDEIDVELGQFVLAGEPIARMGEKRLASAATLNISSEAPVLYLEFRKDGKAIDPTPWWASADNKKVRG
ncbi:murein hydrolase activator EnvC family protein [Polycladidibacter hongkongensis]|uniref:murein hydrolase activator EnvC family protein n=1 Tax=Polycladidibacter hongkongensis TaxID=1647556 RepID=UPI000831F626|nr:peptidoglycan DD-metalloendopeptidase family protein [Pseudovibrio hongkongensis]